jgi:hypothetical protein
VGRRLVQVKIVAVPLWQPPISLGDQVAEASSPFGIEERLQGGSDGLGLRFEPSRGDEVFQGFGQLVRYANRNLF